MLNLLNLAVGGILGTLARYFLSLLTHQILGTAFPYGTVIVNLIGCFIIGFLTSISQEKVLLDQNSRLLLIVGFCGAFTTFSTFMFETATLIKYGETIKALINLLISVFIGFLVFRAGVFLAEII